MAKAPRPGHVKTRLASTGTPAFVVELYRAFIEDSIALGERVGARVALVCPPDDADEISAWIPSRVRVVRQHGRGLAEALSSSFEMLCAQSERVVAFNGDSPHLGPAVLESAFAALVDHDIVAGPCDDGGYYLVGATKAHPGLFAPASLGTGSALESLLAQAGHRGLSSYLTTPHYDVDVPADLARLADELLAAPERAPRTAGVLRAWVPLGA
ncbi:MAG: TIGR04282 family arsenosugar biosynthesis glycosyltransferase [Gemmatimonadaceae bacterium]